MENKFLKIFLRIRVLRLIWLIAILLFSSVAPTANRTLSASVPDRIIMQDGSTFTGAIVSSSVKFKTKYGEIEINTDNIVSFSMDTLVLNDQSKLIGNFSGGNITIEVSNKKLDFPAIEVVGLTTKLTNIQDEKLPSTIQSHSLSSIKNLNRDNAKRILISENLTISSDWYFYTPDEVSTSKSISIPTDTKFLPEFILNKDIYNQVEILRSYWSCLENKNLLIVERIKDNNWPNKLISEGRISLTETGQKYLDKNLNFSFKVIANEITGIQYVDKMDITINEETLGKGTKVAKVFFNGTVESNDNPFNQCFESCWDIQSLLNEPYALFELFDDGWRLKEWNTGGSFISLRKAKHNSDDKKTHLKVPHRELAPKDVSQQEQEKTNAIEEAKEKQIISLQEEGENAVKNQNWNAAIQAYKKLLEIAPEDYDANANIGTAYTMLNEFDLSIKHLTKAQQLRPAEYQPYYFMGVAYARKGDTEHAVESLQDAINRKPADLSASDLVKDTNLPEDFKQDLRFKGLLAKLTFKKLISDVKDTNLFDNHFQEFPNRFEEVWDAVGYALKKQREKIIQSDKQTGIIITDLTFDWDGEIYNKYYILIEKWNESLSVINFKLLTYHRIKNKSKTMEEGFMKMLKGPELKPANSSYTNQVAMSFLECVRKRLKNSK
ncbi:MAG: tetratricopeptide repeat protein [Candidatus Brocadia sp.]|nr:tetratricopeptide repeat protein [Candidatus Brocadia sp.]